MSRYRMGIIVSLILQLPLTVLADSRAEAIGQVLEGKASATDRSSAATALEDLTRITSSPDQVFAALRDIQEGSQIDRLLTGAKLPSPPTQLPELLEVYERIASSWKDGRFTGRLFKDWRAIIQIAKLQRHVQATVAEAPPQGVSLFVLGRTVTLVTRASAGPLALVGAARRLTAIYRDHLGAHPIEEIESFYSNTSLPIFLTDFSHYQFARHLGMTEAVRLTDLLEWTGPPRDLLDAQWNASFIVTLRQIQGLLLARESSRLIRTLVQTWARSLAQLPRVEEYLNRVMEILEVMADSEVGRPIALALLRPYNMLLEEMREPSRPIHFGVLGRAESRLASVRGDVAYLPHLFDLLVKPGSTSPRLSSWGRRGVIAGGFLCNSVRRSCAAIASIPLGAVSLVENIAARAFYAVAPSAPDTTIPTDAWCSRLLIRSHAVTEKSL